MKKNLLFYVLIGITISIGVSCGSNSAKQGSVQKEKITETVSTYLTKQMKNPESFKIISLEIRRDTLPYYLSEYILDKAKETKEALNEFTRYANRSSYLWAEEKYTSAKNAELKREELRDAYQQALQDSLEIEDVAYVTSSGTNPMGGTVSSSHIIIIDKEDPTKILGTFRIDGDFIKTFVVVKMLCEDFEFKKNKFGKYQTEDMPYIEQFIMNDAE